MMPRQFKVLQRKRNGNTVSQVTHEASTDQKPSETNPTIVPGQIQDPTLAAASTTVLDPFVQV